MAPIVGTCLLSVNVGRLRLRAPFNRQIHCDRSCDRLKTNNKGPVYNASDDMKHPCVLNGVQMRFELFKQISHEGH